MKLVSTNPGKDYEVVGEIEISTEEEIKDKILKAHNAKVMWKELGVKKRLEYVENIYSEFVRRKQEFIPLITKEIGKSVKDSRQEVDEFFLVPFKWFIDNAEKALADEVTSEDEKVINRVVYEPRGVTAVIMPWNYPLEMFVWGIIPNLLAGNTVVMKHSEECPLSGKLIEEILTQILPEGVFSEIYGAGDVGEILVNQDIDFLWFTGSCKVGKYLFEKASKKFIKAIMELGGNSPGIIFEDADVDSIIGKVYSKRFSNCGQACSALKRLLVHESLFDEVVDKLAGILKTKITGDPEEENTDFGSLVAKRQLELVKAQINDAVEKGAKIVIGGKEPDNLQGAYYLPTILTNITRDMRVWKEEVFAPVLSVIPFKTEEEAIELANDSKYGLSSFVFTESKEKFGRVASRLEAGYVEWNNSYRTYAEPFGGYKESGQGRELGIIGLRELCQVKVISEKK